MCCFVSRESGELEKPVQEAKASGGLCFYGLVLVHQVPSFNFVSRRL